MTFGEPRDHGDVLITQKSGEYTTFDVTVNRKKTWTAEVPQHAVEEGFKVTDSIRSNAPAFRTKGLISNEPVFLEDDNPRRAQDAFQKILRWFREAKIVKLVTERDVWEILAIKELTESQTADTGYQIPIDLSLQAIEIAETERVEVPPEVLDPEVRATGQSAQNQGEQPPDTPDNDEEKKVEEEKEKAKKQENGMVYGLLFGRDEDPAKDRSSATSGAVNSL